MSKLQDIYQRAYNNTPAATVDDNTVGEAVREQSEREKSRRVVRYQRINGLIWCLLEPGMDRRRASRVILGMLWH